MKSSVSVIAQAEYVLTTFGLSIVDDEPEENEPDGYSSKESER